ncbi:hypothetical protein R5R35_001342 [Gryllus longicercus]|uniref:Uncharacterized protein n=1 Tax=Gryllus longicercus TaxID=2509291 RepID=A0AAN9VGY8_9ORTH
MDEIKMIAENIIKFEKFKQEPDDWLEYPLQTSTTLGEPSTLKSGVKEEDNEEEPKTTVAVFLQPRTDTNDNVVEDTRNPSTVSKQGFTDVYIEVYKMPGLRETTYMPARRNEQGDSHRQGEGAGVYFVRFANQKEAEHYFQMHPEVTLYQYPSCAGDHTGGPSVVVGTGGGEPGYKESSRSEVGTTGVLLVCICQFASQMEAEVFLQKHPEAKLFRHPSCTGNHSDEFSAVVGTLRDLDTNRVTLVRTPADSRQLRYPVGQKVFSQFNLN